MRAIIIATSERPAMKTLTHFHRTYLLKIADKSIIFYVIETLAARGIKKIDIILRDYPEQIEQALGDGKRWGVTITYHLAMHEDYPFTPMLPLIESWKEETVIIGVGDKLPDFPPDLFEKDFMARPCVIVSQLDEESGWSILSSHILKALYKKISLQQLNTWIKDNGQLIKVDSFLSTQTLQDLINSNIKSIDQSTKHFLLPSTAQMVENGVWLSRGISLHPSVSIEPPIFIGEYCQIRAGVHLGPNTIIENHCIVDSRSTIKNSLIFQNSYVGDRLDIQESIIDRNLLINLTHKTSITIREDFILSELRHRSLFTPFIKYIFRMIALIIFILLLPIYLYLKFTCPMKSIRVVRLPASEDTSRWRIIDWVTFNPSPHDRFNVLKSYFKNLPILLLIYKGAVYFVGVSPKTEEEILQLPLDWQKLYLDSKIGLITLGKLNYGSNMTKDEQYASETYYSSQMSVSLDFKLFFRWLKKKLTFKEVI